MKNQRLRPFYSAILFLIFSLGGTVMAQTIDTVKKLSATEFAEQIKNLSRGIIIDARTAKEFEAGHLHDAANYNILLPQEFENEIATLDKSIPVLVYCQSGKRSTVAAAKLHAAGFNHIYELRGGIKEWRESNLKVTKETASYMTRKQYENLLDTEKLVLIEFYSPGCEPCKIQEKNSSLVSKKKKTNVVIHRINVENNPAISKELFIGELPVIHVYKNKHLTWASSGIVKKKEILKHL